MQFTVVFASILSLASAAAIAESSPAKVSGPAAGKLVPHHPSGVCGPLQTPLCCQLDIDGVVNLNCENGKNRTFIPSSPLLHHHSWVHI